MSAGVPPLRLTTRLFPMMYLSGDFDWLAILEAMISALLLFAVLIFCLRLPLSSSRDMSLWPALSGTVMVTVPGPTILLTLRLFAKPVPIGIV